MLANLLAIQSDSQKAINADLLQLDQAEQSGIAMRYQRATRAICQACYGCTYPILNEKSLWFGRCCERTHYC